MTHLGAPLFSAFTSPQQWNALLALRLVARDHIPSQVDINTATASLSSLYVTDTQMFAHDDFLNKSVLLAAAAFATCAADYSSSGFAPSFFFLSTDLYVRRGSEMNLPVVESASGD